MEQWLAHVMPFLQHNDMFTPRTFATFWTGFVNTIQLVFLSVVIGLCMAFPVGIGRASRWWFISKPLWVFTYTFRGTPLLIQLYMAYYGFAFIPGIQDTWFAFFIDKPIYPALLSFALNTTAYSGELFYGGIRATSSGEIEAAKAYGMSTFTMYRRVILPSMFRRVLPAYGNEVIFMLHASAIASVVTIMDLTGAAYTIYARFYSPFPPFIFVACLYMILSFSIQGGFRLLEKRLLRHLNPA